MKVIRKYSSMFGDFFSTYDTGKDGYNYAWKQEYPTICYWDKDGNTSCGHKTEKNDFTHCPYCGATIQILGE